MDGPHVIVGLVAHDVLIDQATNHATIVRMIEQVEVNFDALPPALEGQHAIATGEMALFVLFSWEWPTPIPAAPATVAVRIKTAGGYEGKLTPVTVNKDGNATRNRLVVRIKGFAVDIPGMYAFEVVQDSVVKYSIPFRVNAAKPGVDAEQSPDAQS